MRGAQLKIVLQPSWIWGGSGEKLLQRIGNTLAPNKQIEELEGIFARIVKTEDAYKRAPGWVYNSDHRKSEFRGDLPSVTGTMMADITILQNALLHLKIVEKLKLSSEGLTHDVITALHNSKLRSFIAYQYTGDLENALSPLNDQVINLLLSSENIEQYKDYLYQRYSVDFLLESPNSH